jgi:anaerobic selenocysteine-containing dehydrogenase
MTRLRSACPLDCPDGCSLSVEVEEGRVTWVGAAPQGEQRPNPFTGNFICAKVKRYGERVHGPRRVLTPLLRTGAKGSGSFRPASWEEALDVVAGRLRASIDGPHGAAAIAPYLYNSSAGVLGANGLTPLLFRALGAAEVDHAICAATMGAAWGATYGRMGSAEPDDLAHARLIVLWGANPSVSNTHLVPAIQHAQKTGAELVVVDPRRTTIARRANLHLAVRPGTDAVAALALARYWAHHGLVDERFCADHVDGAEAFLEAAEAWPLDAAARHCDVAAADLAWLAERYAGARPALLRPGWGLERNRNGGASCRAVLALPALVGQFGQRGSGILSALSPGKMLRHRALAEAVLGPQRPADPPRVLNMNLIGAHLCDPSAFDGVPIEVLFIQGANPAATAPDQQRMLAGLARDEVFTVVHDQVLTDSARFADVVLPATTHFETDELVAAYGSPTLELSRAVIPPVGESRTNNEVAAGLAERLGLDAAAFDPSPARLIALLAGPDLDEGATPTRTGPTVQFVDTFPGGARGRALLAALAYQPLEDPYPLTMLSPSTHATINSLLGEVAPADPVVRIHPDDAAHRGIVEGAEVRVFNDRATLVVAARLDADLRPGVVTMPKGMWLDQLPGGLTVNALVPNTTDALAGGACFNDTRVELALNC